MASEAVKRDHVVASFGTLYSAKVNAKRIKNFTSLGNQYAFQNGRNFSLLLQYHTEKRNVLRYNTNEYREMMDIIIPQGGN